MQNFDNQVGKLYMQIPSLRYANFLTENGAKYTSTILYNLAFNCHFRKLWKASISKHNSHICKSVYSKNNFSPVEPILMSETVLFNLKCYRASCRTKTVEEGPSTTASIMKYNTTVSVKSQGNTSITEWCSLPDRNTPLVSKIEKDWGKIFIVEKEVWGDRHNSSIFWRPGKDLLPRGRTGYRITTTLFV